MNPLFDLNRVCVMGILNVTPDSFSDGGKFLDKTRAVQRAVDMVAEGADIIDVGGISTRPGSEAVDVEEELRRVLPVVEALSGKIDVPVSVDTYRAVVAEAALSAGAGIINDISAMQFDPEMAAVVAKSGAGIVLMHIKGTPKDMQLNPVYGDVVEEVYAYLRQRSDAAQQAGIAASRIIIDPGLGFGKTLEHNLSLINNLGRFKDLGHPILIGPSRKAFVGHITNVATPGDRLMGSAAAVAISVYNGASIVRVHDVREMVQVVRAVEAIKAQVCPPNGRGF
ncbi:MAG: dihydropteroate synthase [Nitrospirae bacterium]|uniref:dihydropteroate synthase n=1 Tax=Candidatus Magnetobacterium casense TaxID=1455061 RepID=UPI0006974D94|nr:dihydropteroate synthase [Candidatus Magnetobacterium casensis]MBF0338301.1 dihydropteroate synthase [Nitrospirota bacterium]